jgi:copper chaperone
VKEMAMKFRIDNMNCGGCAKSVTKSIHSVDPGALVEIDLETKSVTVGSSHDEQAFRGALEDAGFPSQPMA